MPSYPGRQHILHSADQKMLFRTGQYFFSVSGKSTLTDLLPLHWKNYEQKEEPGDNNGAVLYLEEGLKQFSEALSDGWFLQCDGRRRRAQYVLQGKAIFELQYSLPAHNFESGPSSGNDNSHDFNNEVTIRVRKALDSYVRSGVHYGMLLALHQSCVGLHGVTLLCKNEIVILSAPSGTGKTTLSRLLEQYCDALVINGDFALLSPSDSGVIFEPTPFCGTSRRCLNQRVRVDRIVFLGQSPVNEWTASTGRQALIRFLNNAFIPSWDSELESAVQNNIIRCISGLKVDQYFFAPVREAAEMFFEQLQ